MAYTVIALYSYGPIQLWPYVSMVHTFMALYIDCLYSDAYTVMALDSQCSIKLWSCIVIAWILMVYMVMAYIVMPVQLWP